ncbi:MAG: alpha/beta hydrolase [Myxococcota bacterium]
MSEAVPLEGAFEIAGGLVAPESTTPPKAILVCLPGGFLSREYFDLRVGEDRTYSFAEAMAKRGYLTLAFDHLGIGESTRPSRIEDGYALGVETIARINQYALERTLGKLSQGKLAAPLPGATSWPPPAEALPTVGVGHSMGSALTVEQQAAARPHSALLLFSFTTRGVPAFLSEDQRGYAGQPERARRDLGELVRRSMGSPYPAAATDSESGRRAAFGVGTAPPETEDALHEASTALLGLGGLLSMLPGGYAPAAEKIDVPALIAVGDHDLHDTEGLREELPLCPDFSAFTLPDCWHCHFVSNQREILWDHVGDWLDDRITP